MHKLCIGNMMIYNKKLGSIGLCSKFLLIKKEENLYLQKNIAFENSISLANILSLGDNWWKEPVVKVQRVTAQYDSAWYCDIL